MEQYVREVMTLPEVAAYLKLSKSTAYRLALGGILPSFKIGNEWRFNRSVIDEWRRIKSAQGVMKK